MAKTSNATIGETLAVLTLVGVLIVQWIFTQIERRVGGRHHAQEMLRAMYRELMILGIIAFGLFLLERVGVGLNKHLFEEVHLALFFLAVAYAASVVLLISLSMRVSRVWKGYEEEYAHDFESYRHLKHDQLSAQRKLGFHDESDSDVLSDGEHEAKVRRSHSEIARTSRRRVRLHGITSDDDDCSDGLSNAQRTIVQSASRQRGSEQTHSNFGIRRSNTYAVRHHTIESRNSDRFSKINIPHDDPRPESESETMKHKRFHDMLGKHQVRMESRAFGSKLRWLSNWIVHPLSMWRYLDLLHAVRFVELRHRFVKRNRLRSDFSFAHYLRECKRHVFQELVEVPLGVWVVIAFLLTFDEYLRGLWTWYKDSITPEIIVIIFSGAMLSIALSVKLKMDSVHFAIMHSVYAKTNVTKSTLRDAADWRAVTTQKSEAHGNRREQLRHQKRLFWLGRPVLLLRALQGGVFIAALIIALVIEFWWIQENSPVDAGSSLSIISLCIAGACVIALSVLTNDVIPKYIISIHVGEMVVPSLLVTTIAKQRQKKHDQEIKRVATSRRLMLRESYSRFGFIRLWLRKRIDSTTAFIIVGGGVLASFLCVANLANDDIDQPGRATAYISLLIILGLFFVEIFLRLFAEGHVFFSKDLIWWSLSDIAIVGCATTAALFGIDNLTADDPSYKAEGAVVIVFRMVRVIRVLRILHNEKKRSIGSLAEKKRTTKPRTASSVSTHRPRSGTSVDYPSLHANAPEAQDHKASAKPRAISFPSTHEKDDQDHGVPSDIPEGKIIQPAHYRDDNMLSINARDQNIPRQLRDRMFEPSKSNKFLLQEPTVIQRANSFPSGPDASTYTQYLTDSRTYADLSDVIGRILTEDYGDTSAADTTHFTKRSGAINTPTEFTHQISEYALSDTATIHSNVWGHSAPLDAEGKVSHLASAATINRHLKGTPSNANCLYPHQISMHTRESTNAATGPGKIHGIDAQNQQQLAHAVLARRALGQFSIPLPLPQHGQVKSESISAARTDSASSMESSIETQREDSEYSVGAGFVPSARMYNLGSLMRKNPHVEDVLKSEHILNRHPTPKSGGSDSATDKSQSERRG